MSLPSANLIWHCPYIVLYSSEDGEVGGKDYLEYAVIKLNGESEDGEGPVKTGFKVKKKEGFPGWDAWKETLKKGIDVEISLEKRGNRIFFKTDNLGIAIESVTTIASGREKVYVALTGDQVALTDICIKKS